MKTIENDSMTQFLQKQPHSLTMAKHSLGIHQLRVMTRMVEKMQPFMSMDVDHTQHQEERWATIKVSELVVGGNVKPLRQALDGMMKKIVRILHYIEEKATYLEIGTPIIQAYKYEHGRDTVEVQISGHLIPQIIDLARGYTKYSIDVAFKTSSPKTFKLYQYISHFRDKKQIQCNLDMLRKWLQIETKYSMPVDIKRRILDPAMRELKEKADVWFDIAERVKDGRKMKGWTFNIYTKKAKRTTQKEDQKKLTNKLSTNEKHGKTFKRLCEKFDLSPSQAIKVIKNVPEKDLHKTLYDINILILAGKVSNRGGYTAKVLSEKYGVKL